MVVAGRLADQPASEAHSAASLGGHGLPSTDAQLIEYEILATEANGEYRVDGRYETTSSKVITFCRVQ